jgi:hypothetical protein
MMSDKDLSKHSAEFARAASALKFEQTESGLWFPEQRASVHGFYATRVNGGAWEVTQNLMPNEGLNYLLSLLGSGTKLPTWYIALYGGNATPASTWTAANFDSNATEIKAASPEGYSESTRVAWVPVLGAQVITNNASAATFTMGVGRQHQRVRRGHAVELDQGFDRRRADLRGQVRRREDLHQR